MSIESVMPSNHLILCRPLLISTYDKHDENVHENPSPSLKRILILGGGYGGVGVETFV